MPEKYGFSRWVWILTAVVVVGFVVLGSYLVQTKQRLKAVEIELGRAKEETVRAKAGAAELAKVAENLRLELKAAKTARNEFQGKLDKANDTIAELSKKLDTAQSDLGKQQSQMQVMEAELEHAKRAADQAKAEAAEGENKLDKANDAIAELSKKLDTAQSDLGKQQSQLQAMEAEFKDAKQAADQAKAEAAEGENKLDKANNAIAELSKKLDTAQSDLGKQQSQLQAMEAEFKAAKQAADQAKAEAAEGEKQITKLRQGIASCEEFFNEWEVRGAPVSISAIAALGREAAAAKDCIDKGDVPTACKHWQGLLVEIEKMGPPVSESRGDIEELMRQNRCEAESNSAPN